MHYLVIFVIDDIEKCPALFDAWERLGVTGITILESTGLGRIRKAIGYRDDIPLMPSIRNLLQSREEHHRTLLTVIDGDEMIDKITNVTQQVVGDLNQPNKGVLIVLPVARVVGLER